MLLSPRIIEKAEHFLFFAQAISYRIPLPIREICVRGYHHSFPVCPRCAQTLDREYMAFCDRCGQRINWKTLPQAKIRKTNRQG